MQPSFQIVLLSSSAINVADIQSMRRKSIVSQANILLNEIQKTNRFYMSTSVIMADADNASDERRSTAR
jgi:hypothetical protein